MRPTPVAALPRCALVPSWEAGKRWPDWSYKHLIPTPAQFHLPPRYLRCYMVYFMPRESECDGMHVVELEGEIDMARSPDLREVLEKQAKARRPAVGLDFTAVSFIDSSGLATIVEYCRKAHEFGGKIAVFGLNERVRTVFELVRLNELFGVHETREQARAALLHPGSSAA